MNSEVLWRDDLEFCDPGRYSRALDEIVEVVKRQPGAASVYMFGDIGAPGVSDLDVLVIWTSRPPRSLSRQLREVTLDKDSYIWLHPVFMASPATLSQMRWVHPSQKLKRIWGTDYAVNSLPEDVAGLIEIANYHDFTSTVHMGVDSLRRSGVAGVRRGVVSLTSMKNSLDLAASISGQPRNPFCVDVETLRREIATVGHRPVHADLSALFADGYRRVQHADLQVWETLRSRGLISKGRQNIRMTLFGHRLRYFDPENSRPEGAAGEIELPLSYWLVACAYAGAKGNLGRFHRDLYRASLRRNELMPAFEEALLTRIGVAEQLFSWLGDTGFPLFLPLGTAHLTPTPIHWRIERRLRALRAWLRE